jgi:hypothetical protein
MSLVADPDLLIIARERVVVQRFGEMAANVEIRLDTRRMERRRAPLPGANEERRRRDRRAMDVSNQLRTVGWVFIAAAQRRAVPPEMDAPRADAAPAPIDSGDATQDESSIGQRLAGALLCAPCLARTSGIRLDRVERALERLQGAGALRILGTRCEECRKTTLVYAPDRN